MNPKRVSFGRWSYHVEGPKREKAQEPTVESPVRGIWWLRVSEAEQRGRKGYVKLETEIKRSGACDIFIAESVYLVLISLRNWKPVERLKQRSDKSMSLFNVFYLFVRCCLFLVVCFQDGANCTVVNALKAMTKGKGTGRQENVAVDEA